LLKEAGNLEDRTALKLFVYLGLRVSEACHLNTDWVSQGEVTIPLSQPCECSNCTSSQHPGEWHAKSKAAARVLPVIDILAVDLYDFLRLSPRGFQMTRQGMWWKIKYLAKNANIHVKGLSHGTIYPHVLRATCATKLAIKGMSAPALCYWMGWASISMGEHYINIARAKSEAHAQYRHIMGQ